MDWTQFERILLDFAKRKETSVSFATLTKMIRGMRPSIVAIPPDVRSSSQKKYVLFAEAWVRLQVVRQAVAVDFPPELYIKLAQACPRAFAWLMANGNNGHNGKRKGGEQFAEADAVSHDMAHLKLLEDVPKTENLTDDLILGVLELHEAYTTCRTRKLPAAALVRFQHQMQLYMNSEFYSKRREKVEKPQDALETTLSLLLSLEPRLGHVSEVITLSNSETFETRQASSHSIQVMYLQNCAGSLQACIDRFEEPRAIDAVTTHRVRFRSPGSTLFLMFNVPGEVLRLDSAERVLIDGVEFGVAGVLLYAHGHFTSLVATAGRHWVLCNDTAAACNEVPGLTAYLQSVGSQAVRAVVLRKTSKLRAATSIVNFTNVHNSCYMSSVLQLMFHCCSYMKRLRRQVSKAIT